MQKSEPTPASWKYIETPNDPDFVGEIQGICAIYVGNNETDSNAQLIAAAPELLEALEYAKRFLKKEDVDMNFIEYAIIKAKGL